MVLESRLGFRMVLEYRSGFRMDLEYIEQALQWPQDIQNWL